LSLLGILVGLASAILGIGGGSIIVPAIIYAYPQLGSASVTSVSLMFILILTLINIYNFRKSGLIFHKKVVLVVGAACFVFGFIISMVNISMPKHIFQFVFASILFLVGIKVATAKQNAGNLSHDIVLHELKIWKLILTGILTGAISGLTGLGGGIVLIPLFINFLKFPFRVISSYSNAIMIFAVSGSLIPHLLTKIEPMQTQSILLKYWIGDLPILLILPLIILSPIGSILGVKIDQKLQPKTKKITYFILLMILSTRLFITAYQSL
jgi:uncharacterized membrane protein YfcA